eukprot:TRINITY_DN5323_c0_g1_i1.p1 TRINITY_DN5323_c0_g1~~TRINITY_DN5323_c0_g1_i1.p1  ORF type:complete len:466 (-),score=111.50 TRINITY_DN5323_c0_g1_i1:71-1408(-)
MEISQHNLENFAQDFEENGNAMAQNAITKNAVLDCIMNRKDFVELSQHVYSDVIPKEGTPTTSQKASGRCWLFAALNCLRVPFMEAKKIASFEFSQSYLFFHDKLEKSNYFLNKIIETREEPLNGRVVMWLLESTNLISDGGQWDMLVNLINKYGVVPKEVYPESTSSSSSREMNKILRAKLREFACVLRQEKASEEELLELKNVQMNEIYRMLCTFLGTPPTRFSWSYQNTDKEHVSFSDITPQDFYQEHVQSVIDINDYVCLINAPTSDKPFNHLFTVQHLGNVVGGHPVRYINVTIEDLKKYASAQIVEGKEPVWFGCEVGKFFHKSCGILDIDIFNHELAFGTSLGLTKSQRLDYGESAMTHAMVFTAINRDGDHITKWRVENSWGTTGGDKGYLIMSDKWFSEYVFEAVVHKKFLPEEILNILNEEPILLPPWDPMGSLA